MSRLDELINELCPEGVEYRLLKDIAEIGTGSGNSNEGLKSGKYPFFVRSQEPSWKNEYEYDETAIITAGDGVGVGKVFHYVEGKYALHQRAYRIHITYPVLIPKFYYYYMTATFLPYIQKSMFIGSVPSIRRPMLNKYPIPLPPLAVQREIVRILDKFTEYTAELTAELTARRKQYEYYRDKLLTFGDEVEYKKIKEVFRRLRGTPITAKKMKEIAVPDGEIKIFAGGKTIIDAYEKDIPNANITRVPAVLVQSRGVIDFIYYDKPFTFKNEMWAYTTGDKVSVKFLYYVLKNDVMKFRDMASGMGSLPQISLPVTEEYEIPLPPLSEQHRIVSILDRFDSLCNDITSGLPAEIAARKKQYEYYRDKLLTFKRKE